MLPLHVKEHLRASGRQHLPVAIPGEEPPSHPMAFARHSPPPATVCACSCFPCPQVFDYGLHTSVDVYPSNISDPSEIDHDVEVVGWGQEEGEHGLK